MATGLLLALANTVVIAIGLAIAVPSRDLAGAIVVFGFVPALLLGCLSGGIALLTDRHPRWVRLILMTPFPIAFVYLGATGMKLGAAGQGAMIPTFIAILLLERWSRHRTDEPTLPLAKVR